MQVPRVPRVQFSIDMWKGVTFSWAKSLKCVELAGKISHCCISDGVGGYFVVAAGRFS